MAKLKKPIYEDGKAVTKPVYSGGNVVRGKVPVQKPVYGGGKAITKTIYPPGGEVRREIPKPAVAKPVPRAIVKSTVKTKGGDYPVYGKQSGAGMLFRQAFADARRAGKKQFVWQGRKYTTEMA